MLITNLGRVADFTLAELKQLDAGHVPKPIAILLSLLFVVFLHIFIYSS